MASLLPEANDIYQIKYKKQDHNSCFSFKPFIGSSICYVLKKNLKIATERNLFLSFPLLSSSFLIARHAKANCRLKSPDSISYFAYFTCINCLIDANVQNARLFNSFNFAFITNRTSNYTHTHTRTQTRRTIFKFHFSPLAGMANSWNSFD